MRILKIILPLAFLFYAHQQSNDFVFCADEFFVSVYNEGIIDKRGRGMSLRGIQIDFGSIRGDIPRNLGENNRPEEFFDKMLEYVVTEDDFRNIKSMGANIIRLSLNTYKDFEYDTNPFFYREENLKILDKLIEWAKKYGIYVIISMRQSPGGHNSSPHSGNNGLNQLWSNANNQKRLIALWHKIAARYAENPIIVGYDLLNEPLAPNKTIFNKVYKDITRAIRKVDGNHIIFLEGNSWGKNISWIDDPKDPNTAFSIHFYMPGIYAVKGEGSYPSRIKDKIFNRDNLRKQLRRMVAYGQKLNRPVWVGEFGAMSRADNYLQYDQDLIQIFEEENLPWTYWNYKNLRGKSDTQAIYYTNSNNKFFQLISRIRKSKETLSRIDNQKWKEALESLSTEHFQEKSELRNLLTDAFHY